MNYLLTPLYYTKTNILSKSKESTMNPTILPSLFEAERQRETRGRVDNMTSRFERNP